MTTDLAARSTSILAPLARSEPSAHERPGVRASGFDLFAQKVLDITVVLPCLMKKAPWRRASRKPWAP